MNFPLNSMTVARRAAMALTAVSALWLTGCSSAVKLDEPSAPPRIESRNVSGQGNGSTSSLPASNVAPVVVAQDTSADDLAQLSRVIYFDFDSFLVKDEFRSVLEGHTKVLMAARSKRVFVEGHTDERGGREYNLALGQKRAEAVVKSLTLLGVSPDQVEAVSFGEERPAATGSTEEAWAKNRRAELKAR